jgi:hypothetical protein
MFKKFLKSVILSTLLLTGTMASGTEPTVVGGDHGVADDQQTLKAADDERERLLEENDLEFEENAILYDLTTLRILDAGVKEGVDVKKENKIIFVYGPAFANTGALDGLVKLTKLKDGTYSWTPFKHYTGKSLFSSSPGRQIALPLGRSNPIFISHYEARGIERLCNRKIEYLPQSLHTTDITHESKGKTGKVRYHTERVRVRDADVVYRKVFSRKLSADSMNDCSYIAINYNGLNEIFDDFDEPTIFLELKPTIFGETIRYIAELKMFSLDPTSKQLLNVYKIGLSEDDSGFETKKDYTIVLPNLAQPALETSDTTA